MTVVFKIGDRVKLRSIADNIAGYSGSERDYWTSAFPGLVGTVAAIEGDVITVNSDLAGHGMTTNAQFLEKV